MPDRIGLGRDDAVGGDVDVAGDLGEIDAVDQPAIAGRFEDQSLARRQREALLALERRKRRFVPQVAQPDRRVVRELEVGGGQVDLRLRQSAVEQCDCLAPAAQRLDDDLRIVRIIGDHTLVAADGDAVRSGDVVARVEVTDFTPVRQPRPQQGRHAVERSLRAGGPVRLPEPVPVGPAAAAGTGNGMVGFGHWLIGGAIIVALLAAAGAGVTRLRRRKTH